MSQSGNVVIYLMLVPLILVLTLTKGTQSNVAFRFLEHSLKKLFYNMISKFFRISIAVLIFQIVILND